MGTGARLETLQQFGVNNDRINKDLAGPGNCGPGCRRDSQLFQLEPGRPYVVFPGGAICLGLFLISRLLEKEIARHLS
jgi:hypothetical protein